MKLKLVFGRTEYDYCTAWTGVKVIEVDVPIEQPDDDSHKWQVIGGEWLKQEVD